MGYTNDLVGTSQLADFIRRNFMGANITVRLVNNTTITGEVVDGFDNVIGLKANNNVINFINVFFITNFV